MTRLANLKEWSRTDEAMRLREGKTEATVLLGSGISIWAPTNIPAGKALTEQILSAIFGSERLNNDILSQCLRDLPLEVLLDACPEPDALKLLMKELFNRDQPNPVHISFAKALREGKIRHIVTTNYDLGLDTSVKSLANIIRVVKQSECERLDLQQNHCYFKIHGSADDGSDGTMVLRLGEEGSLPTWKRNLLSLLIRGKTLLIVGYSGLDFDICPELSQASPASVIWNLRPMEKPSQNAALVLSRVNGGVVRADMRKLLAFIGYPTKAHMVQVPEADPIETFRRSFSDPIRRLWSLRILNMVCYPKRARGELDRLESFSIKGTEQEFHLEEARTLFHEGLYRESALAYRRLSECAKTPDLVDYLLDSAEAWSEYGAWRSYSSTLDRAQAEINVLKEPDVKEAMQAKLDRKRLLPYIKSCNFQIVLATPVVNKFLANKIASTTKGLSTIFLRHGMWFEHEHLRLWLRRLGLKVAPTRDGDVLSPLHGYIHLNYIIAQMTVYRDIARGSYHWLIPNDVHLRTLIQRADQLGSHPESWKLRALIFRRLGLLRLPWQVKEWRKMWREFRMCQYSPTRRAIQLERNLIF